MLPALCGDNGRASAAAPALHPALRPALRPRVLPSPGARGAAASQLPQTLVTSLSPRSPQRFRRRAVVSVRLDWCVSCHREVVVTPQSCFLTLGFASAGVDGAGSVVCAVGGGDSEWGSETARDIGGAKEK